MIIPGLGDIQRFWQMYYDSERGYFVLPNRADNFFIQDDVLYEKRQSGPHIWCCRINEINKIPERMGNQYFVATTEEQAKKMAAVMTQIEKEWRRQ